MQCGINYDNMVKRENNNKDIRQVQPEWKIVMETKIYATKTKVIKIINLRKGKQGKEIEQSLKNYNISRNLKKK